MIDHLSTESESVRAGLARPEKDGLQIQLMAQGLRRVERLTAQHGVTVSRIMEPPYGIVNREFIQALASLDYAGVLVTPSQFLKVNTSYDGPASFGMERAETFTNGLGMIPRIVMGNKAPTEMVLAALLDQPIVVAAHHYDVADGMSWLSSYAARLQTGGPIQWCDLSTLLEGSYETLAENDRLRIRTGARTIKVTIPDNIHAIIVERPWIHSLVREPLCIRTTSDEIVAKVTVGDVSDPIPIPAGTTLRIETTPSNIQPADRITDPGVALWPKVRRTLMEARDRLYPWALKSLKPLLPGNDF